MGTLTGYDPNAFGPFGALFQNYFAALESLSQGKSPIDPQASTAQLTAPLKAAARCQLEVLGLVNRRTQAYLQVPTRLAQCRTPHDLLNEQMAFWRVAGEQYRESALRIGDAWSHVFPWAGAYSGITTPAERDYISFNNGSGNRESSAPASRQEPAGKPQRRVA